MGVDAAGAFADLAADLGWILNLPPGPLTLDGHLTIPDQAPDTGLGAIALVNQATGVLIGGGHSPGDALSEVHRLARHAGLSPVKFAAQLVDASRNAP